MIKILALFAIGYFCSARSTVLDTLNGAMGVNIHFAKPKIEELGAIRNAGLTWVRVDFKWASSETVEGIYDFSVYDRLLDSLEANKIRPLLILSYGNPHYDSGAPPRSEKALAAFGRWAGAAARRYQGRGAIWEVWNEPNMPGFWPPAPNVSEYITLLSRVSKAIRTADANAVLVGPAYAGMAHNELEQCLRLGLLDLVDGVSFHPYRNFMPESFLDGYLSYQRLINKWSKGKYVPVVISEWGYSSCASPKENCISDSLQALWLVRLRLITWVAKIPLTIWYDWQDDGENSSKREYRFGLVRANSRFEGGTPSAPKESYFAQRTVANWIAAIELKEYSKSAAGVYLIRGEKQGRQAIVTWCEQGRKKMQIPKISSKMSCITSSGDACGVVKNETGAHIVDVLPTPRLYEEIR